MIYELKNLCKKISALAILLLLTSCYPYYYAEDETAVVLDEFHNSLPASPIFSRTPDAIMLCRSHQCATASKMNNREFIFNSLWYFFDSHVYSTVMLCEADEIHRRCYDNFISFPVTAGITPGNMFVDSADLSDVRMLKNEQQIELILNYKYYFNGVLPNCRPSRSILSVNSPDQIILDGSMGHECKLTTIGGSLITTVYSIDFIDLDYGLIGAHYSVGVAGTAHGGKVGYMLMRFVKDGIPRRNPDLFKTENIKHINKKECDTTGINTCVFCPDTAPYWRNGICQPCHSAKGTSDYCNLEGQYCNANYECKECDSTSVTVCPTCPKDRPYWRNNSCKPCYANMGISDYCSYEGFQCDPSFECVECDSFGANTCASCPEYLPYWRNKSCKPCFSNIGNSLMCLEPNKCDQNFNCTAFVEPPKNTVSPTANTSKNKQSDLPPGEVIYLPVPLEE